MTDTDFVVYNAIKATSSKHTIDQHKQSGYGINQESLSLYRSSMNRKSNIDKRNQTDIFNKGKQKNVLDTQIRLRFCKTAVLMWTTIPISPIISKATILLAPDIVTSFVIDF